MFRKDLILTAGTCLLLENLRLILEVLYGSRIRFKHIHLDKGLQSGQGCIYVDGQEIEISFIHRPDGQSDIWTKDDMYYARFDNPHTVRVINMRFSSRTNWVVGTSHSDRHEETLK